MTKNNKDLKLNICFAYNSEFEIYQAMKNIKEKN